jgi:hypothetical protein
MSLPFAMDAIVNLFLTHTVTVYRYTESYEKGRLQRSVKKFKCKAGVQPLKGELLQRPPQANDDGEWLTLFSPFKFQLKDEVLIDGTHYQVEKLQDWQANGKFTQVLCSRFHHTEVGPDWVTMPGIAFTPTLGTPTVLAQNTITVDSIEDTETVGTPTVTASATISVASISDTSSVGTPEKVEIDWRTNLVLAWDFNDPSNFGTGAI